MVYIWIKIWPQNAIYIVLHVANVHFACLWRDIIYIYLYDCANVCAL